MNAIGCLVLSGVVVMQWSKERSADQERLVIQSALTKARDQAAAEVKRSAGLERDIAVLKESIESTRKAAGELLAEKLNLSTAAAEQAKSWQAAITERDAKLRALDADLTATRQRLDEAIARLKVADGR